MTLTDIILLIVSITLPMFYLLKPVYDYKKEISSKSLKDFISVYKFELITIIFLIIGFILRLYKIGQVPLGFNQDEASLGYDAYAILNYGIDRNGISIPVHLIAWGSGQNALYAYLCMPFIKLFGLTVFAIRLPMALIGCISLIVMKKLLEIVGNPKITAIGIFIFSIMPWHIMKSRWGLESNIFPDLILLAVLLIILGVKNKKGFLYTGCAVLGLSAYAYGTSYFFLPVFSLILFIYLLVHKIINYRRAIISFTIIFFVSLPIILFVLINKFGWNSIETLFFTIPKLNSARQASILNLEGNFFSAIFSNIKGGLALLFLQTDGLPWNSIIFYGTHYIISLPFLALGIFAMFSKRGFKYDYVFFIWLITSLLMLFVMSANINRINIIYIPIIYFVTLGIYTVISGIKGSWIPVFATYSVVAAMFVFNYFGSYQNTISYYFFNGLGNAIEYSEEIGPSRVIVSNRINAPYIFELFYNRTDPNHYIDSVIKANPGAAFETISGYGKYIFEEINANTLENNTIYIIESYMDDVIKSIYPSAEIRTFENYSVVVINPIN